MRSISARFLYIFSSRSESLNFTFLFSSFLGRFTFNLFCAFIKSFEVCSSLFRSVQVCSSHYQVLSSHYQVLSSHYKVSLNRLTFLRSLSILYQVLSSPFKSLLSLIKSNQVLLSHYPVS